MKALLATLSLAALSTASFAAPTQFSIPATQLTRAEVQADVNQPSRLVDHGEAINFTIPQGEQSRAQVRAEAASANGSLSSNEMRMAGERRLYVGG